MKEWRIVPDMCDICGSDEVEIFTDATLPYWGYDSDDTRCVNCGAEGYMSLGDSEDDFYINWDWDTGDENK